MLRKKQKKKDSPKKREFKEEKMSDSEKKSKPNLSEKGKQRNKQKFYNFDVIKRTKKRNIFEFWFCKVREWENSFVN